MKKSFVLMKIRKMNLNYIRKSDIIAITLENLEELLIVFDIPVVIHNGSTYDYHFIIKQLGEEFKGRFEFLGENTEKYITFSVPIKNELDNGKAITHKRKSCHMSTSLSNLIDNLSGIYKKECKTCMERKKNQIKFFQV